MNTYGEWKRVVSFASGCLNRGKQPPPTGTQCMEGRFVRRVGLHMQKRRLFSLPGFEHRPFFVHPVARRCADYAIPPAREKRLSVPIMEVAVLIGWHSPLVYGLLYRNNMKYSIVQEEKRVLNLPAWGYFRRRSFYVRPQDTRLRFINSCIIVYMKKHVMGEAGTINIVYYKASLIVPKFLKL
jgi:hypothetical protein